MRCGIFVCKRSSSCISDSILNGVGKEERRSKATRHPSDRYNTRYRRILINRQVCLLYSESIKIIQIHNLPGPNAQSRAKRLRSVHPKILHIVVLEPTTKNVRENHPHILTPVPFPKPIFTKPA